MRSPLGGGFSLGAVASLALVVSSPALAQATLTDLQQHSWPTILAGASLNGSLDRSDVLRDDGSYTDGFFYDAQQGETITITMRSADFDSWLVVDDPNGALHEHDDDSGGGRDSRLTVTFPHAGRYLILANDVTSGATGNYSLTLTSDHQGSGTTTASNQVPNEQWARCGDNDNKYPLDVQVGACTALLQSGQLDDQHLALAYLDRGITFKWQQNYDRAIADYSDALRVKPDYALAFAERGSAEFELERYDSADNDFAAALRIDAKNAVALNGQGRLRLRTKDYAQARDLFSQAISSDSTDAAFVDNRALAYTGLGDSEHAVADYTDALRIDPRNEFALVHRANVYEYLDRYADAVADFDKAVEIDSSAWNHNLACWERAAFVGQELDRAKSECDKAVALDPKNPEILDSRGMLRLKLKQYQGAWADYDAAIKLNPKNASYWYGRAMAERAQGKTAAARADITKAKALDPKIAQTYERYGFKP
jgi:tetratricopeptide (TPR) repeat protein